MGTNFSKDLKQLFEEEEQQGIAEEVDGLFYYMYVLTMDAIEFEETNEDPKKENEALATINKLKNFVEGRLRSKEAKRIIAAKKLDDIEKGTSIVKLRAATMDLFKELRDAKKQQAEKQEEK